MAFDVTAVLKANVSNFTSGIKEAQSVFESFQSKSNRTFENVANGFQTAGLALSAGLTAPALAGIGAVVKGYASLEQNLGGTEAVFGQFAKSVQNDAKSAYQTMGLSASDYMATANKMGSLFQGSGVEQQKALDMTSKAMKRAADVASVMGVDMNMAMESVAGAAKGNFTMMDNLGVAMNATTLEAYALEKGLNFKWETASNAEKAELAMQMFMDRTKQYDGNFLKESEKTVAGSLDAMKGAFQNFVAGLGNPEADVAQLMTNLQTTVQNFAKNVGNVVKTIWDNLPLAPWQKWVALIAVGAGPVLLALSGIMKGIGTLKATFQGIGAVLSNPWGLAIVSIAALVAGLVYAYQHSETFRNIVDGAISSVVAKFNELKTAVQPALDSVKSSLDKLNIGAFGPLIAGAGLAFAAFLKFGSLKLPNPFAGFANSAKSAGSTVVGVFKGIGSAIGSAFKGIAGAISMLNPMGVASFALGVAAVTAALVALSAAKDLVLPFLQGLADVFVQLVGGVLQAFVAAFVALTPVFAPLASALALLSPLIVAIGQAFAAASPFVTALGAVVAQVVSIIVAALPSIISAISGLVTAIANGIAQVVTAITPVIQILTTAIVQIVDILAQAIVQIVDIIVQAIPPILAALTPIVEIVGNVFTNVVQIIADAVVKIVQALAPFIPSISEMVQAVASVLQGIVAAINNLISQISPIIDSIANLFKVLGEQISSILESIGSVIESFGSAIRNVLDGVAGIFESMGKAAKNAGQGVKLMAQGIKILVDLKLGDLVGTLAAVATGLGAIADSGIATAGPGLQSAGVGMKLIATAGILASAALVALPTAISAFVASLGSIQSATSTAGTALTIFGAGASVSLTGLTKAQAQVTGFSARLLTIISATNIVEAGLSSVDRHAIHSSSSISRMGEQASSASSKLTNLGTIIVKAMSSSVTAITTAGTQMAVSMQANMSKVVNAVRNGMNNAVNAVRNGSMQMASAFRSSGTSMSIAAQSLIAQVISTIRSGYSSMVTAGNYIAQGLAVGIRQSISDVVSASKELIEQANKAAKDVARIKSPSRLFRDEVGHWIGAGIAVGIERSSGLVEQSLGMIQEGVDMFKLDTSHLTEAIQADLNLTSIQDSLQGAVSIAPATVTHSITASANESRVVGKINELIQAVQEGQVIVMDSGALVGATSHKMDSSLGGNAQRGGRFSFQ